MTTTPTDLKSLPQSLVSPRRGAELYAEYVAILQKKHPAFASTSDRVREAARFAKANAEHLLDFDTPELHPDCCRAVREQAFRSAARAATDHYERDSVHGKNANL